MIFTALKGDPEVTGKSSFYFLGRAPLSKALLNRAWLVRAWFPDFKIQGENPCDDTQVMIRALSGPLEKTLDCRLSASAFRFLALYLARRGGEYLLTGRPALLKNRIRELPVILSQLGVTARRESSGWRIVSEGWKPQGDCLHIPYKTTSQYASGLLLSGWNLKRDLFFSLNRNQVSLDHFKMTLNFVRELGMNVREGSDGGYAIPAGQTLKALHYKPEQDQNCLFTLAGLAVLRGKAVFSHWEENSLQPEAVFPGILEKMGVTVQREKGRLTVLKPQRLKPLERNLKSTPDLFPVLAVLCARAEGTSRLTGLRHLAFKESHRLNQMAALLRSAKISVEKTDDSFTIHGRGWEKDTPPFAFDGAGDHRIVMSAVLLSGPKTPIHITGKEAVNKSFPDFFKYTGRI